MKIIHSERIHRWFKENLKGYIAINTRTFKPHKKSCVVTDPLPNEEFPFMYIQLYDNIGCCVIYKNKDTTSELVYIHDASLLGFPSHQSLVDSNRLSEGEFVLDISNMNIPDSYNVLDEGGQLSVPYVNIDEMVYKLETLNLEDKKRYISIALFSILYEDRYPIFNIKYYLTKSSIYDSRNDIPRIVSNINKIIEIAEEHNIIINMEDILEWIMDGIHYLGFRKYSAKELKSMDKVHVADVHCWTYLPTDFISKTHIRLELYRSSTHANKRTTHVSIDSVHAYSYKEYYNDRHIPNILHFIYRVILGIEDYTL